MRKREYDYEAELEIDPNALDVEWLDQPNRFMKYAEAAAEARHTSDEMKANAEVVLAEISRKIRKRPAKYGASKATQAAVEEAALLQPEYQEALNAYNQAKFRLDLMMSAVRAFDQRKVALENMVRLQGQSYFAPPSEPRDLGMEWDRRVKSRSAKSKVKKGLNKSTSSDGDDEPKKRKKKKTRRTN